MSQQKTQLASNSIFWVEVEKIKPNPYQPRREFDQDALRALSDSIRQYGVLQPLVVTRREVAKPDGGIMVEYELIAGERRLRASKLAGVAQVPVVIRVGEDDNLMKLELAIIENLQREDLNPVDRAKAFRQFIDEFGYKHAEIAKKVGKSREYVSNSLRLLMLSDEILDAIVAGKITEGHARPIMMLQDRPEEQMTLFKEVMFKKLTVRDAENIARRCAQDKVRKKERNFDPEILRLEKKLTEQLGTRVHIEPRDVGGKITIDFFSDTDLKNILTLINSSEGSSVLQHMKNEEDDLFDRRVTETIPAVEEVKVIAEEVEDSVEETKEPAFAHLQTIPFGGFPKKNEAFKREAVVTPKESVAGNQSLGEVLRNVLEHSASHNGAKDSVAGGEMLREALMADSSADFSLQPQKIAEEGPGVIDTAMFGNDDDFFLPDTDELRNEVNEIIASAQKQDPHSTLIDFVGEVS